MARIKLIIFDVGGVIDTFDERKYVKYISKKLGLNASRFQAFLLPMLDRLEVGRMTLKEMLHRMSKEFKVPESSLEWDAAFPVLNSVNKDVVALMRRLSSRYTIAILTNVSRSRHQMKMHEYLGKVRCKRIFASCYIGIAKPDPRIYRLVLKRMGFSPKEALFIDNMERNTNGARAVGIDAIRFVGYKALMSQLSKRGIK